MLFQCFHKEFKVHNIFFSFHKTLFNSEIVPYLRTQFCASNVCEGLVKRAIRKYLGLCHYNARVLLSSTFLLKTSKSKLKVSYIIRSFRLITLSFDHSLVCFVVVARSADEKEKSPENVPENAKQLIMSIPHSDFNSIKSNFVSFCFAKDWWRVAWMGLIVHRFLKTHSTFIYFHCRMDGSNPKISSRRLMNFKASNEFAILLPFRAASHYQKLLRNVQRIEHQTWIRLKRWVIWWSQLSNSSTMTYREGYRPTSAYGRMIV